jgi:hypothetical protein
MGCVGKGSRRVGGGGVDKVDKKERVQEIGEIGESVEREQENRCEVNDVEALKGGRGSKQNRGKHPKKRVLR